VKLFVVVAAVIATLSALACGGSSSGNSAGSAESPLARALRKAGPEDPVPHGPPPSKLVVKVIEKGSGPAMRNGEVATARYIEVDYRTGRIYEQRWSPPDPTSFNVGQREVLAAWEAGMKGMRVGGRRELVLPAKLAYTHVPVVYVVELMAVED
jgi:peptidylprolyl isomerase